MWNHDAARVALEAFPGWGELPPDEDLRPWVMDHLRRVHVLSSTEEAVLHLAASLLGICEYQAVTHGRCGEEMLVRRAVPPLGDILAASFDEARRAQVAEALEVALHPGPRPLAHPDEGVSLVGSGRIAPRPRP